MRGLLAARSGIIAAGGTPPAPQVSGTSDGLGSGWIQNFTAGALASPFTVNTPTTITRVGTYVSSGNSIAPIGITSGAPTTFPPTYIAHAPGSGTGPNDFTGQDLSSPITLQPGTTYYLVWNADSVNVDAVATDNAPGTALSGCVATAPQSGCLIWNGSAWQSTSNRVGFILNHPVQGTTDGDNVSGTTTAQGNSFASPFTVNQTVTIDSLKVMMSSSAGNPLPAGSKFGIATAFFDGGAPNYLGVYTTPGPITPGVTQSYQGPFPIPSTVLVPGITYYLVVEFAAGTGSGVAVNIDHNGSAVTGCIATAPNINNILGIDLGTPTWSYGGGSNFTDTRRMRFDISGVPGGTTVGDTFNRGTSGTPITLIGSTASDGTHTWSQRGGGDSGNAKTNGTRLKIDAGNIGVEFSYAFTRNAAEISFDAFVPGSGGFSIVFDAAFGNATIQCNVEKTSGTTADIKLFENGVQIGATGSFTGLSNTTTDTYLVSWDGTNLSLTVAGQTITRTPGTATTIVAGMVYWDTGALGTGPWEFDNFVIT